MPLSAALESVKLPVPEMYAQRQPGTLKRHKRFAGGVSRDPNE